MGTAYNPTHPGKGATLGHQQGGGCGGSRVDNGDAHQGDEYGYGQKEMDLEDVQEGESTCWVYEGVLGKRGIRTDF